MLLTWAAAVRNLFSSPRITRSAYRRQPRQRLRRRRGTACEYWFGTAAEVCEARMLLTAAGPTITGVTPNQVENAAFDHIDVAFGSAIDASTFTTADISITGPVGSSPVNLTGVNQLDATDFRVTFDALTTRGTYTVTIGPNIADLAGHLMDQNQNGTAGEASDQFTGTLFYANANAVFTSSTTINETNTSFDGKDLLIDGTTVRIDGAHTFNSIQLINGAVLTEDAGTASQMHTLDLTVAEQVIVDATSAIDVSGRGYVAGHTTGNTTVGAATGRGGGSYGSLGAVNNGSPNAVYGDYANPNDWGSGSGLSATVPGGGLVRITAGSLQLDGRIRADGSSNSDGGGGSGGGVYVAVSTLTGSGLIEAIGNSGGGGGRVAVYAPDMTGFDTTTIRSGTVYLRNPNDSNGTLIIAGPGTTPLGLPGQTAATIPDAVVVTGAGVTVQAEHSGMTITFSGGLLIENQAYVFADDATQFLFPAQLEITSEARFEAFGTVQSDVTILVDGGQLWGGTYIAPDLSVLDGGVVTSSQPTSSRVFLLKLLISDKLIVDSKSAIDVSGRGYVAGHTTGNTTVGAATGRGGGSYGGLGATGSGSTNALYGDAADPEDWGSGSGLAATVPGGGLVRITAGSLQLDGRISADGSGNSDGGGGSGGGIYVAVSTLTGTGLMEANGNNGGGGGRVAVYAQDFTNFDTTKITARGPSVGADGTVFLLKGVPHTHVRSVSPIGLPSTTFAGQGNGYVNHTIDSVTLTFNNPIDLTSFNDSTLIVTGQMGTTHAISMTQVGDRTYRFDFPFVFTENGPYHFELSPTLRDAQGFALDQNVNGVPGEDSDAYSFDLTVDTIPPRITQNTPAGDVAGTVDHVDIWFSKAIYVPSFTPSDVVITRPDNQTLAPSSIQEVGLNRFRISFAPQTLVGLYHVVIGPSIEDLAGNLMDQNQDGIQGQPGVDTFDASFNIVPVSLGLNNLSVSPTGLVAGQAVTVSWSGANLTGAPLIGNWTDGIYISASDHWDINAILLGTVQHTGGLTPGQTYSGSLTAIVPGLLPGNYHIFVRADVFQQEVEGPTTPNNVVLSGPLLLTVTQIPTDGTSRGGTLTPGSPANYFTLHVNGGDSLALNLQGLGTGAVNELYVSLGAVPTRTSYDFRAVKDEAFLDRQDQTLAFTAPAGGATYYILVYGDGISGSNPYQFSATTGSFVVTGLTPPLQGNGQAATLTLSGAGFDSATTVQFVGADSTVHVPTAIHFVSPAALTLDLDLPTWKPQNYSVLVTKNGTTITASQTFQVVAAGKSDLQTRLVVPSNLVVRGKQTLWLEYTNAGTEPMAAPVLRVVGDRSALITLDPQLAALAQATAGQQNWPPAGVSSQVEVLATGSGATPGILQPGDSGRIPIYYLGVGAPFGGFQLAGQFALSAITDRAISVTTTVRTPVFDTTGQLIGYRITESTVDDSIHWSDGGSPSTPSLEDQMRPASIPADAWAAIWQNLQQQIGTQYADYDAAIANDATYLYSVGQNVTNVGALWNFEIAKAADSLNPLPVLADSVDAAVATPGLSLSFSRVFGSSILARYREGAFGRGWTDNWDISAETETNGDVVLRGPNGADRFFTLSEGAYEAPPGDFGQLALTGNGYRLTETDKTIWQFRSDGKLDFVQDTNGNRITCGYANGLLTSLTHSNGKQLLIAYDGNGHIASVTDPSGANGPLVTTYQYDTSGEHLIQVTAPGNRVTKYTYDTGSNLPSMHALLSVEYADGTHDFFSYDSEGRLIGTSRDGGAQAVTYSYDSAGGVTVTDATGRQTFLSYGLNGQLAQARDGQRRIVNFGFNQNQLFSQLVGPQGEKYSYQYDSSGNVTGVTDAAHQSTQFSYDPTFNHLTGFVDANGNGMQYQYDARGNLTRISYLDGTHEDFTYDAQGNVLTDTNRRGQTIAYTYNAAGQVLTKDDLTTPGVDFMYSYDAAGNLTSATDSQGTTTMSYDPRTNLLTRIVYPGGQSFDYEYDALGRRTKQTDQLGHVENYFYDSAGRLSKMTDENGALIVQYAYDDAGRLATKTLGNGIYTTYEYDAAGNVLHLVNFKPDGTVLSRFDYTYDASGLQTSMATLDGTWTYSYDPLGQLVHAVFASTNPSMQNQDLQYVYDAAGNRIKTITNGVETDYTTNALNEYVTVGDTAYQYDADGNLISQTTNGQATTYTYNAQNQLVGVTSPTDAWTYGYDAFGNRVVETHNGQTTTDVIDPAGIGNLAGQYDSSGNLVSRYDYGLGLVSEVSTAAGPGFYTFSAIGNTSELTGEDATVLDAYAYDPFGSLLVANENLANPFQFGGRDGLTTLLSGSYQFRQRTYNTPLGRFMEGDPSGLSGGVNLYEYAFNSPISFNDVTGQAAQRADDDRFSLENGGTAKIPLKVLPWLPNDKDPGPQLVPEPEHAETPEQYQERLRDWLDKAEAIDDLPAKAAALPIAVVGGESATAIGIAAFEFTNTIAILYRPPPGQGDTGLTGFIDDLKIIFDWLIRLAHDPNNKLAPAGVGNSAFVPAESPLNYQAQFENDSAALAPAQQVVVTDTLDPNLDLSTFQLNEIDFAGQTIAVPAGLDQYETEVPMTADGVPILVDVNAALDRDTRQLTLTLRAIDPSTGWLPDDPQIGILYPIDATGRGDGSISYSAKPVAGLPSGTVIQNRANIVFDYNDPIQTPLVSNTIDDAAPTSTVQALPATTTGNQFTLQWSGQDESGGSGIAGYDLYVSEDGGPFNLFVQGTQDTSMTVFGDPGHTYSFYSIATDNVGHVESKPAIAEATTTLLSALGVTAGPDQSVTEGDLVSLSGATFTSDAPTDQLNLQVDWGDGTIETGLLAPGTGGGTIGNTHRYKHAGNYDVTLTLDDGVNPTAIDQLHVAVADAALMITGLTPPSPTEGISTGNIIVATFSDANPVADSNDLSATIVWGDGNTSTATAANGGIIANNDGTFSVLGSNTYAEVATGLSFSVTINDVGGANRSESAVINVADAPLTDTTPTAVKNATEGNSTGTVVLATFTDANPLAPLADFAATVDWGGTLVGTPSVATVELVSRSDNDSTWQVVSSATYAEKGNYTVAVTVNDADGSNFQSSETTIDVADAPLTDTTPATVQSAIEGNSTGSVVLATFTDDNPFALPGDFTATVDWGGALIGTPSVATVQLVSRSDSNSTWQVVASATYAEAGNDTAKVTVNDRDGSTFQSSQTTFSVADAPLTDKSVAQTINAIAGTSTGSVVLATFTDGDSSAALGDFSATVNWGGTLIGTPSVAVQLVSRSASVSTWQVVGSATYAQKGTFTAQVSVNDKDGSPLQSSQTSFDVAEANLQLVGYSIQHGLTERSFIRFIDLDFSTTAGLSKLVSQGIRLTRYDINGLHPTNVSLAGRITVTSTHLTIDLGPNGIGGNRNTTAGDGTYRLALDLAGNSSFSTVIQFHRLLGDLNGDSVVNPADFGAFFSALVAGDPNGDTNGDDKLDLRDLLNVALSLGRKIKPPA